MNRPLLALAALVLAALPARATAQDSTRVAVPAVCSAGTVAFMTGNARERAEMDTAVSRSNEGSEIQRIVEITREGDKPRLRNQSTVSRTLERNFPANRRTMPDSAEVTVLMRVDEHGVVTHTAIHRSTEDQGFNDPAMAVVKSMRFRPAKYDGCEVPFWGLLPITFHARR